jgi:hypothetical protein
MTPQARFFTGNQHTERQGNQTGEQNQGASEAKELILKGQNLAGDLCARSS